MNAAQQARPRTSNGTRPSVEIAPMERGDLKAVRAIDALVYPRPWSTNLYLDELSRADSRVYLTARHTAEPDDVEGSGSDREAASNSRATRRRASASGVIGYIGLMAMTDEGHITSVAVHPQHQGAGVGARLMLALHQALRTPGCPTSGSVSAVTLEVRTGNTAAQRLYRWFGYAPVAVRKGYYRDRFVNPQVSLRRERTPEDALVMWCHEVQGPDHGERLADIKRTLEGQP